MKLALFSGLLPTARIIMVTVNGYITTPVFGGQEGDLFNDIFCSSKDTGTLFFPYHLLGVSHHYDLDRCLLGQRFREYVLGYCYGRPDLQAVNQS